MRESDCRGFREGCGNTVPTITDDQLAEIEASRDMHGKIMNIGHGQKSPIMTAGEWLAYRSGHRDARHAAAEIALAGDAEIERLRAMIEAANDQLAEVMRERYYLLDQHKAILELLKDSHACIGNDRARAECGLMIVTMEDYLK